MIRQCPWVKTWKVEAESRHWKELRLGLAEQCECSLHLRLLRWGSLLSLQVCDESALIIFSRCNASSSINWHSNSRDRLLRKTEIIRDVAPSCSSQGGDTNIEHVKRVIMVVGISSWRVSATCWRSWGLSRLIRRARNWRIWSPALHAPNLHVVAYVSVLDNVDDSRGYQRMWYIDSQWLDSFKNVLEKKNPSASSTNWLCGEVNSSVE